MNARPESGPPAKPAPARDPASGPRSPAAVPACHPLSGCITCSDEGVPMRVLEADPTRALAMCADEAGSRAEVMTDLVGPVSPGDRLLVHAGTALLVLDRETVTGADS